MDKLTIVLSVFMLIPISVFIWLFFDYLPKKTSKLKSIKDQKLTNGHLILAGHFFFEGWNGLIQGDILSIDSSELVINKFLIIRKEQVKNIILASDSLHIEYDELGVSKFLLFLGSIGLSMINELEWKSYLDNFGYQYQVQKYSECQFKMYYGADSVAYPAKVSFSIYVAAPRTGQEMKQVKTMKYVIYGTFFIIGLFFVSVFVLFALKSL